MRTIRASEIGAYLFCARAWWYRSQGVEPQNQAELAGGTAFHHRHARQVIHAGVLRALGLGLLVLGILALSAALTIYFLR